jgi:GTP cyclohydrolase II
MNSKSNYKSDYVSPGKSELRIYGMGAQILNELHVRKMILLTNTDWKFIGLDAYGIDIVEKKFLAEM